MKDNVLLRTENMSRKYVISDRRETEIEVLKDINLEIREQEFISITWTVRPSDIRKIVF